MLLMRVAWLIVILVGVLVLSLVFGLQLFHRMDDGQKLLDDANPIFVDEPNRVEGARAGINIVSTIVDLADPLVLAEPAVAASAADEVLPLVKFVADNSELSEAEVLAALQENVPKTTSLLLALPLEDVTAELPDLITLISQVTGLTEEETLAAIQETFPGIAQASTALPIVTDEWKNVAGTEELALTRFDGETPVRSVPDVRDYFSADVIPVLERQRVNFQHLNGIAPNLNAIPWLLTGIGGLVVFFGGLMFLVTGRMRFEASPSVPPRRRAGLGEAGGAPPRIGSS